jgi:flavoprotein
MVKIQIDLSEDEDKIVEMFKLSNNLKTKQEAIKQMVKYFKVEIKPTHLKEKDYFSV